MSFEAMAWAVRQEAGGYAAKLILLMLANHANGYSGQCNPSHKRMAEECEMSETCVKKHIKALEEKGLLRIQCNFGRDGKQVANSYILSMGKEGVAKITTSRDTTGEGAQNDWGGGRDTTGEGAQNDYKPVIEPISEPVKRNNTRQARNGLYETEFEEVWSAYPKRPGNSKPTALRAFIARRKAGHSLETILRGVRAYYAYCVAKSIDSGYVKLITTFLGAGEYFLADWSIKTSADTNAGVKGSLGSILLAVQNERKAEEKNGN